MFDIPRRHLLGSFVSSAMGAPAAQAAPFAQPHHRQSPDKDRDQGPIARSPMGYDVQGFGAIWDGESHPLSERFASLSQARDVYPFALSLADEVDWAATQLAINRAVLDWALSGHRYGTTILLPPGVGRFNRTIFYPANRVWLSDNFPVVHLQGHGRGSTFLEWRDNASPIEDGYVLQPRLARVEGQRVYWEGDHALLHADCRLSGFALRGPGTWHDFPAPTNSREFEERYGFLPDEWEEGFNRQNARIGQLYEAFGGLSAGECTCLSDLFVEGFHVGINWRGGQKLASYVYVRDCYYGLHVTFTPEAHGDFLLQKCNFSGRFAAIALAPDAGFFGHLDTCYIGNSPYGFFKEGTEEDLTSEEAAERFGGHWNDFISGMLTYCQFESIGNAILCEGNINRRHQISDLTLENCAYVDWHDFSFPRSDRGYKGAILTDALIDVARWSRVSILRSMAPARWRPRDQALFMFGEAEEVIIDSCDGFLATAAESEKPLFFCSGDGAKASGSIRIGGDGWTGCVHYLDRDLLRSAEALIDTGDLVGRYSQGCRAFTADALDLVGVAMEPGRPREGTACLAVATEAEAPLPLNHDGATAEAGDWWLPSKAYAGKVSISSKPTGLSFSQTDERKIHSNFSKTLATALSALRN
jgi:hypothetical protein